MTADDPIQRRRFLRAMTLDATRSVGMMLGLAGGLRAAAIDALSLLGEDHQDDAEVVKAGRSWAYEISEAEGLRIRVAGFDTTGATHVSCRSAADLAAQIRLGRVEFGSYLGPIALHALAGTALETSAMSAEQRWNALAASAKLLVRTAAASGPISNAPAFVDRIRDADFEVGASAVAASFREAAERMATEIERDNVEIARMFGRIAQTLGARNFLSLGLLATDQGAPAESSLEGLAATVPAIRAFVVASRHGDVPWSRLGQTSQRGAFRAELIEHGEVGALIASGRVDCVVLGPSLVNDEFVLASTGSYAAAVLAAVHSIPCLALAPSAAMARTPVTRAIGDVTRWPSFSGDGVDRIPRELISASLSGPHDLPTEMNKGA